MKKKEKVVIFILLIITVIMAIFLIVKNNSNKAEQTGENKEEIVTDASGIKQNKREKVIADKQLGALKVENISMEESNGMMTIRANIVNTTGIEQDEFPITIALKNEKEEIIENVGAYVGKMAVGETRQILASMNQDIAQVYDIAFNKE